MIRVCFNVYLGPDSYLVTIHDVGNGIQMHVENETTRQFIAITSSGIADMLHRSGYLQGVAYKNCPHCGFPKLVLYSRFCHACRTIFEDNVCYWEPGLKPNDWIPTKL